MSHHRRITRPDSTQSDIVDGLRAAGILVYVIGHPCDLLTYYPPLKRWRPLEAKPLKPKKRKDQKDQDEFLKVTGTPIVRTAEEAIREVTRP